MRRFRAMPLFSVLIRCSTRSATSGRAPPEPGFQSCHIQFGGSQQRAQLIVQLARQVAAFVLPDILQMGRQLGQGGRTLTHLRFKQVTFALQRSLLANAGRQQGLGLQQVHVEREQTRQRHDGHANTRKL